MGVLAPVALAGMLALAAVINPGPELAGSVDRVLSDPAITESSGLALSARFPGVLYTHNDSDGDPVVFAVDTSGTTVARLNLADAPARDWEAMAAGSQAGVPVLWVADIGDNISGWESVRLLKFTEPAELTDQSVQWERFDLVYPDGPHNAETLLLHPDGRMWIVTKEASGPGIYAVPQPLRAGATNQLTRVAEAPTGVTDGAIDAAGRVVLVDYVYAYTADSIDGPWVRSPLPFRPQGESVTWDGADLLVGSEGGNSEVLRISTEPLDGAAADSSTPPATDSNGAAPAPGAATGTGGGLPGWAPWAVGAAVGTLVAVVLIRQRRDDQQSAPRTDAD